MTIEKKESVGSASVVDEATVTDNWTGGGDQQLVNAPDSQSRNIDLRGVNSLADEIAEIDKKIEAGEPLESQPQPAPQAGGKQDEGAPGSEQPKPDDKKVEQEQPKPAQPTNDELKQIDEKYLDALLANTPNLQRYRSQGIQRILENYNNGVGVMERIRSVANNFGVSTLDFIQHMEQLATDPRPASRQEAVAEAQPQFTDAQVNAIAEELSVKPETVKSMVELIKSGLGLSEYQQRLQRIESEVGQTREVSNRTQWENLWNGFSTDPKRTTLAQKVGQEELWKVLTQLEAERPGYCAGLVRQGQNPYERALKEYVFAQKPELLMEYMGAVPNKPEAPNVQVPTGNADPKRTTRSKNRASEMTDEELEQEAARLTGDSTFIGATKVR